MNTNHLSLAAFASVLSVAMLGGACGGQVVFEVGGAGGTLSSPATTGVTTKASTSHVATNSAVVGTTGPVTTNNVAVGTTSSGPPSCQTTCETQHAAGFGILELATIHTCGCEPTSPCQPQCENTSACNVPPGAPNGQCAMCLQTETEMGTASACALNAATSPQCQTNADCAALIMCILSCP